MSEFASWSAELAATRLDPVGQRWINSKTGILAALAQLLPQSTPRGGGSRSEGGRIVERSGGGAPPKAVRGFHPQRPATDHPGA